MDFQELCTDSFQETFDIKPSKLDEFSLDTDFGFTPSALSELPCDLGSSLQLEIPDSLRSITAVETTEEQNELPGSLFPSSITNPFDGLGLGELEAAAKPSLAASLTAQASFGVSNKLTKKGRFQPYENGKKGERAVGEDYKHSDEYRLRREKNNEAVRKSRAKAKLKSKETEETVQQLRRENTDLKRSLDDLQNQLDTLKTLLTAQAE